MSDVMMTIEDALRLAVEAHDGQKRKGKNRPYVLHLMEMINAL